MRKRIWIPCIIALLAVCLLLLINPKRREQNPQAEEDKIVTNRPAEAGRPQMLRDNQTTNTPRNITLPQDATPLAQAVAVTNPTAGIKLAWWQAPMEFYGKVVDETSNAVSGASVQFQWMELPTDDGSRMSSTQSDAEGLFSLQGAHGPSLDVLVSKGGYYPRKGGAQYGFTAASPFSPDPLNPVVFCLRKKARGADLLTSGNGIRPNLAVRIPRDNTPVRVDLFLKQPSPAGQLEISQNKPPLRDATEWSFRMTIPDGGIVESQDEFLFEAPVANYQTAVEYHFARSDTNWTTQVSKQFYVRFGEPPKYGWLRIDSNLGQETIFLTYAVNPDGSRNLEPAN